MVDDVQKYLQTKGLGIDQSAVLKSSHFDSLWMLGEIDWLTMLLFIRLTNASKWVLQ